MNETTENKIVSFYGTYGKEIYRNNFNGYCVFTVNVSNPAKLIAQHNKLSAKVTCSGEIPEYRSSTPLLIKGRVVNTRYGFQIETESVEEKSWDDTSLATYLSNICSGVGVSTATALVDIYGNDIFELVKQENASEQIANRMSSISVETATILCETIANTGIQKEVYTLIAPFGGTWVNALKVTQQYGIYSIKELNSNPYAVGKECNLDFYVCDQMAKKAGVSATDDMRIKQALLRAFHSEQSRGNVFSTENDICKAAQRVVRKSAFNENIPSSMFLDALTKDNDFVIQFDNEGTEGVYLRSMLKAEEDTAAQLHRLHVTSVDLPFDSSIVEWAENECGIKYAPQQKASFELIKRSGVAVITGGPGTGKTTTVNGLINAYEKLNPNKIIKLCAPTGRAAQRMTESTGRESITIHRLLDYRPYGKDVSYKSAADPIIADLIVVDEASMLDIELASIFLSAVQSGALVLFIGDINQLPSVGAGDVLHDLIGSGRIPTVQLTTVYRQGSRSPIIVNANRINEGTSLFEEDEDYKTISSGAPQSVGMRAVAIASSMFDKENPFDTQILCPTHKGEAGVAMINTSMQRLLNPPVGQSEIKYGNRVYRVGDKVILLNNNYNIGYFNGDLGIITAADNDGIDVDIFGRKLRISKTEMEDINLAYAMTIHKSQGSEFKNVIISLPAKPQNMLKRNLLYTAVTRAKKKVFVIHEGDAVVTAVNTCETGKRNTRLIERIITLFNEPAKT